MTKLTAEAIYDSYFMKTHVVPRLNAADGKKLSQLVDKRDQASLTFTNSEREIERLLERYEFM